MTICETAGVGEGEGEGEVVVGVGVAAGLNAATNTAATAMRTIAAIINAFMFNNIAFLITYMHPYFS